MIAGHDKALLQEHSSSLKDAFRILKTLRIALTIACSALAVSGCALTPEPLSELELAGMAADRTSRAFADQEPVIGPISLFEAMARALKYNLDHQIENRQRALRLRELDLSTYQMLPQLVTNSGYAQRDQFAASRSIGIDPTTSAPTGFDVLSFNTSQERQIRTADLTFSWHVLDFGLSYVRAQQLADQALIAEEMRRKVVNRIIEDVRTAFWRAASADRLMRRLRRLQARTKAALAGARSMSAERHAALLSALTYQRDLLEIRKKIEDLERDLATTRVQLATLMNLPPDTRFELQSESEDPFRLEMPRDADQLIGTALLNRPELREIAYKQRINRQEAKAALLELLPGLQLYAGSNIDDNAYLLHGDWLSWGAKAAWNLMKFAQYPARRRVLEGEDELLDQRALAMTVAVMTQVHVARVRLFQNRRQFATAREYLDVQRGLTENMRVEFSAGRISEQTIIREEMNLLLAEVGRDLAHADLQNSYANVFASVGIDPLGSSMKIEKDTPISTIAEGIRQGWTGGRDRLSPRVLAMSK